MRHGEGEPPWCAVCLTVTTATDLRGERVCGGCRTPLRHDVFALTPATDPMRSVWDARAFAALYAEQHADD